MEENNSEINNINNNIKNPSENYFDDLFIVSETEAIPDNLITSLKINHSFVLSFINPNSGPRQGVTVLEYAELFKSKSILNYKIISFPIQIDQNQENGLKELINKKDLNEIKRYNSYPSGSNYEFSSIFFNILNKEDVQRGVKFIKKYISSFPNNKIKILIGGGDGSTVRFIEELINEEINLSKCIFGIIPIGTGNDLSNTLGFGGEVAINGIISLQNLLYKYFNATPTKLDIWEINVKLDEHQGYIYDYDSTKKKSLDFKRSFVNYFSMGYDAIIGFTFEPKRTSNRCYNKFIYALEGFKRFICCKKNYGMTELFESFQEEITNLELKNITNKERNSIDFSKNSEGNSTDFSDIEEVKNDPLLIKEEKDNFIEDNRKIIFKTKNSGNISSNIILKGNPVSIVCQNIFYYMGGVKNIWANSSNLGIAPEETTKSQFKEYKKDIFDSFQEQSYNDKKLEILVYENSVEEALENIKRGMGNRIYQGSGPFYFKFKNNVNNLEQKGIGNVYLNLDGEFYHLENPLEISIKINNNICNGQLNFLQNLLNNK